MTGLFDHSRLRDREKTVSWTKVEFNPCSSAPSAFSVVRMFRVFAGQIVDRMILEIVGARLI